MKIISFNLRYQNDEDGEYSFINRREHIVSFLKNLQADVIAFQEALPEMVSWLRQNLSGYYLLGVEREVGFLGESMVLAYRYDTINLHSTQTFWLSETPDVPGSRYKHQSICPRTCMASVLYSITDKKLFRVLNTHLDHEGAKARISGLEQVLRFYDTEGEKQALPTFILGDFNAIPSGREMKCIYEHKDFYECSESIPATFHDFGRLKHPQKIDYIFATKDVTLRACGILTDGSYLTDHHPIYADIDFM